MAILMMAHAKINWALEVTGVRPDGYHALDMLMQRIDLADELFSSRWMEKASLPGDAIWWCARQTR